MNIKKSLLSPVLLLILLASSLFGANPLTEMKTAFNTQAESNVIPVLIFWVMIFGAIVSFVMKQWMPFVMALIVSVAMGMSPDLATGFVSTDFTTS